MEDISATHNSEKLANPITDSSGDPVTLDDNPAHVAGFLYEVSRYFQREGLHSALIRYGAVVLNNGTTAVSQLNQIPFVLQSITYASSAKPVTYTIESPFPIEVDDAIATYTGLDPSHNFDPFTVKTVPSGFIHQPLIVQQEDAKLGGMLLRAIEDETFREEMQDKSGGNGRVLGFSFSPITARPPSRETSRSSPPSTTPSLPLGSPAHSRASPSTSGSSYS